MTHTLNLPELPEPKQFQAELVWDVALTLDGLIGVRLVAKYRTLDDQTLLRFEARDQADAEDQAERSWSNYQAVHGGAA